MVRQLFRYWVIAAVALGLSPLPAFATCRQALLLGLDVSASVDVQEYTGQMQGLAGTLTDPDVVAMFLATPSSPVALSIFEWSGRDYQRLLVDWTEITTAMQLNQIAAKLNKENRGDIARPTAIGAALHFAVQHFHRGPPCNRLTLDISGDGKNNDGTRPESSRQLLNNMGATVNALAIGGDNIKSLESYFRFVVITGLGAFVETALGYDDYANAMKRKLLRELSLIISMR